VGLCDYGSLAGSIEFLNAAKDKDIKPILGEVIYINPNPTFHEKDNTSFSYLNVISRNLEGWKSLVRIHNEAQKNFYNVPRVSLDDFGDAKGLLVYSGHIGTSIANSIFGDHRLAYQSLSYDEAKGCIDPDWYKKAVKEINRHIDIFGKNFFLSVCDVDKENWPVVNIISKAIRFIAKKEKVKCVGIGDSHYINREDSIDHHIVLAKGAKTTIPKIMSTLGVNGYVDNAQFFRSMNYGMISPEVANELYSEEELENTAELADMVERYSIFNKPLLPKFECPDNKSAEEYIKELAREGWRKKIQGVVPKFRLREYADRIKHELDVLKSDLLYKYFLITEDYVSWARNQGWLVGAGRGSAGGCLLSYLLGITGLDPIEEDLSFERFYNAGRNTDDHVAIPDIDCDFRIDDRVKIVDYLRDKYGDDRIVQVATFGRLQGRGCLKEVLRVHDVVSFTEMNNITVHIPDESKISDQLQKMEDEGKESGIIRWSLENNSKELKEWCFLNENKEYCGPLAKHFQQAARLEGVRVSLGRHASAIGMIPQEVISLSPKVRSKGDAKHMILAFDMHGMDQLGILKADILGTKVLDYMDGVSKFLAGVEND